MASNCRRLSHHYHAVFRICFALREAFVSVGFPPSTIYEASVLSRRRIIHTHCTLPPALDTNANEHYYNKTKGLLVCVCQPQNERAAAARTQNAPSARARHTRVDHQRRDSTSITTSNAHPTRPTASTFQQFVCVCVRENVCVYTNIQLSKGLN